MLYVAEREGWDLGCGLRSARVMVALGRCGNVPGTPVKSPVAVPECTWGLRADF